MKSKDTRPSMEVRLPELQIGSIAKRILNRVANIRYTHWVIAISTLLLLFLIFMPTDIWDFLWRRIRAQLVLVSMILVFCAVAVSLIWKKGQRLDVWVFMAFNVRGKRAPWADWMMLGLTQLGNGIFAMGLAVIFFFQVDRLLAYELVLGTLTLWLVVELLKIIIRRTRPYLKLKNIRIIGSRARGHSFPSGHTSQAFYVATMVLHYFNYGMSGMLALYALALAVGITRIYVGMHYPRDVVGGAVFGTAWGLLSVVINSYIR